MEQNKSESQLIVQSPFARTYFTGQRPTWKWETCLKLVSARTLDKEKMKNTFFNSNMDAAIRGAVIRQLGTDSIQMLSLIDRIVARSL